MEASDNEEVEERRDISIGDKITIPRTVHNYEEEIEPTRSECDMGSVRGSSGIKEHSERVQYRHEGIFRKHSPYLFRLCRAARIQRWFAICESDKEGKEELKALWDSTDEYLEKAFEQFIGSNSMASWKSFVFKSDVINNIHIVNGKEDYEAMLDDYISVVPVNDDIGTDIFGVIEKSKTGVIHFHVMVKTNKRIDSLRRLFNAHIVKQGKEGTMQCIKGESVSHLAGLFKYFLKAPELVVCGNANIMAAAVSVLTHEEHQWKENVMPKVNKNVECILALMKEYRVYTLEDLMRKCSDQMKHLLALPSLNTIIQNCALFLNVKSDLYDLKKSLLERATLNFGNKANIYAFLERQQINPVKFGEHIHEWLWQLHPKKNTFVLYGPPNTGKSSFIRPLLGLFRWGQIQQSSQFMFQNCLRKEIVVWEEPLISKDYADKCKLLFEGSVQMVEVKSHASQLLERTPIIITTNKPIWKHCSNDKIAFQARCYIYDFNVVYSDLPERTIESRISSPTDTGNRKSIGNRITNSRPGFGSQSNSPRESIRSRSPTDLQRRFTSAINANSSGSDTDDFQCSGTVLQHERDNKRSRRGTSPSILSTEPTGSPSHSPESANKHNHSIEWVPTSPTNSKSPTTEHEFGCSPIDGSCGPYSSRTRIDEQCESSLSSIQLCRAPRKPKRPLTKSPTNKPGASDRIPGGRGNDNRRPYRPHCSPISPDIRRRGSPDLRVSAERTTDSGSELDRESRPITEQDWIDFLGFFIYLERCRQ